MESKPMLLTTIDNPFHPGTQFNEWFAFDIRKGYNTLGLWFRLNRMKPPFQNNHSLKNSYQFCEIFPIPDPFQRRGRGSRKIGPPSASPPPSKNPRRVKMVCGLNPTQTYLERKETHDEAERSR